MPIWPIINILFWRELARKFKYCHLIFTISFRQYSLIDTTNDLNGELLAQAGLEEGIITEISEKTEDIAPVTVKLQEGNDTSSASAPADPIVTGSDPKTNDSDQDQEYDQTVITETPREVTATMGESSVVSGTGENIETQVDIGLTPVEQVWNENKQEVLKFYHLMKVMLPFTFRCFLML